MATYYTYMEASAGDIAEARMDGKRGKCMLPLFCAADRIGKFDARAACGPGGE